VSEWRLRLLWLWLWSIAAATLATVVIGGATRLTHSGLSIVAWQPLIGVVPPLNEAAWTEAFEKYKEFPEYRIRQGMTLSEFKGIFLWEYAHRLVARLIGVLFLVPLIAFWRLGWLVRPLARRALVLFALGATQGIVGWLMVRSGLVDRPSVSHYRLALHLALAVCIFGYSVWLATDLRTSTLQSDARGGRRMTRGLTLVGVLLALQIVWGAFVAGLKAGLIFNTFPLMAGAIWFPGVVSEPALLDFVREPATVQWTHRLLGTLLLVATAAHFSSVRRRAAAPRIRRLNASLLALVAVQYLLGVLTLVLRVPISLAVLHQATAVLIVGVWVVWMHDERCG
jgi:cytochrome c oxidase assembly protein subunit 15